MEAFWAGLVAGYGIAVPVGAVAAYIVALAARTSLRVGGAAGLGAATADGLYATVAVLGGAALAGVLADAGPTLTWASAAVLLGLAVRIAVQGLREHRRPRPVDAPAPTGALRAYTVVLAATLLNPTTVVYFAALVLGNGARVAGAATSGRVLFVAGAFLASASWQLLLAGSGVALGRVLTGRRGRLGTALVSAFLVAALAVRTALV